MRKKQQQRERHTEIETVRKRSGNNKQEQNKEIWKGDQTKEC